MFLTFICLAKMERIPNEIMHMVCLYAGYKSTLQLCRTCKDLNRRLTEDDLLWEKFFEAHHGFKGVSRYSKEKFLDFLCFDLWLDDLGLPEADKHICKGRMDL